MQGDFSRDTFDPRQGFSRVLMQQGRVLLDADWNEQTSILLHYVRTLATDLIGPHGGPEGEGFRIGCMDAHDEELTNDFTIGYGRYYVDGILCENMPPDSCLPEEGAPPALLYTGQPYYPYDDPLDSGEYLVYLDVWEQHLTYLQARSIREVALGGPDTSTRTRIVWQVKVAEGQDLSCDDLPQFLPARSACLSARARVEEPSDDPCIIPPEARYRGAENQLYRVEIHADGSAGPNGGATFKWSRDNGSVVFAVREAQEGSVLLDTLGPDDRRGLTEGDWVEIVDDHLTLQGRPGVLARVEEVDRLAYRVTLSPSDGEGLPDFDSESTTHPILRRWDQGGDALPVQEGRWIDLEDGVQVRFETLQAGGAYRSGDYWLIPARTAVGDVLWPSESSAGGTQAPKAIPPHGIEHHYAPLGIISVQPDGTVSCAEAPYGEGDCRCPIGPPCADAPGAATAPQGGRAFERIRETSEDLTAIMDVGPSRAETLVEMGRRTTADVAGMTVEEIQDALKVSDNVARRIKTSADELAKGRG